MVPCVTSPQLFVTTLVVLWTRGDTVHSAMAVTHSEQLQYFRMAFSRDVGGCCSDSVSMMPSLKASFERGRRQGLLVDVGANVGNTVAAMVRIFGEQMLGYPRHFDWQSGGCMNINGPFTVYAFEPNPEATGKLADRFAEVDPQAGKVHVVGNAVADESGYKALQHIPGVDPMASFVVAPAEGVYKSDVVKLVTLDVFFGSHASLIHLLKIDAEGFDALVLSGGSRLLSQGLVKFIVFEYSPLWAHVGRSLKQTVVELESHGYLCFFILTVALVPLSGWWWQSRYESHAWRNVFCGREADHDLFTAYVSFGTNRYTMAYALNSLQVIPRHLANASRQCARSLRC